MGFDTDLFVKQPVDDNFICAICHSVQERPTVTCGQGHTYCNACITRWQRTSHRCPGCRSHIIFNVLNLPIQDIIMSLQVRCPEQRIKRARDDDDESCNKQECCGWEGPLSHYLEGHNKGQCQFRTVPCSLGCGKKVPAGDLENHKEKECMNRIVTCSLCEEEFPETLRFYHEGFKCLEKETNCEYCGETMLRKDLGDMPFGNSPLDIPPELVALSFQFYSGHYKTCPKVCIYCDFHEYGCKEIISRDDMDNHRAKCAQAHEGLVQQRFKIATNEGSMCWSKACIVWRIPVCDIQEAQSSTCSYIQESEYVRVGEYRTFLRLIVKDGVVNVFACVDDPPCQPCITHLGIQVGPAVFCDENRYFVTMRRDGGKRKTWSSGDALRYTPFSENISMATPELLLKWSHDGCAIFHVPSQVKTVVGSRPNQCNHLSDEAMKDLFYDSDG